MHISFSFLRYYTTQELQRSTLTIMKRITSPTCSEGENKLEVIKMDKTYFIYVKQSE